MIKFLSFVFLSNLWKNKKQILGLQSQGQNLTVQVMLATDHRISYAPAPLLGDLAFLLRYPTPLTHVCTHAMVETKNSPGPVFARTKDELNAFPIKEEAFHAIRIKAFKS